MDTAASAGAVVEAKRIWRLGIAESDFSTHLGLVDVETGLLRTKADEFCLIGSASFSDDVGVSRTDWQARMGSVWQIMVSCCDLRGSSTVR